MIKISLLLPNVIPTLATLFWISKMQGRSHSCFLLVDHSQHAKIKPQNYPQLIRNGHRTREGAELEKNASFLGNLQHCDQSAKPGLLQLCVRKKEGPDHCMWADSAANIALNAFVLRTNVNPCIYIYIYIKGLWTLKPVWSRELKVCETSHKLLPNHHSQNASMLGWSSHIWFHLI